MSTPDEEPKTFLTDADIEDLSRSLHEQIGQLREQVRAARARLSKTAREQALEQDHDKA
jgi:hypothetical protein